MKLSVLIPLYNREDTIIRALESIPGRKDIEIIVCDDGSIDGSFDEVLSYREKHIEKNIVLLYNKRNMGVGYTMNKLYDNATGEYVLPLGSDDYFIHNQLELFIKELNGEDMVYFNMINDENFVYELNKISKDLLVGSTKATKRSFLGNSRCSLKRIGEDKDLYEELQKKNPKEKFTGIILKHYTTNRNDRLSRKEV